MQSVLSSRFGQVALAAALLALLWSMPAAALDLFARHTVTVQFATADGNPMADAEVRVFAPGRPSRPELTGRTDSTGKFEFSANTDGLWSAEARGGSEIARVMVRVGSTEENEPLSPYWVVGGLLLLLILAFAFRVARRRSRARPRA
jgi:MYXO-CTERM domain-containing protein